MAGRNRQPQAAPAISPEKRAQIAKAANQVAAYANFLRWTANFRRDEVIRHPRHARVMLLSPLQSGRFSFAIEGDTLLLGVQPFEAAWFAAMPFVGAYVSERLYLSIDGVDCLDGTISPLALGLFVDDAAKRRRMAAAQWAQPVRVAVQTGRVAAVSGALGSRFPIKSGDIIQQLIETARQQRQQHDMGRFF